MKRILTLAALALALSCGTALAGHGKAGLWDVSTTMDMAGAMPAEVLAQMKQAGMSMPAAQTFKSQICMTQAEVDANTPPRVGKNDTGCDTHVTSMTASGMTAEMTCSGQMKGTGHMQIAYTGAEHYSGSYAFKGSVEGHPTGMASNFRGDWVKSDCGAVKPYVPSK